MGRAQVVEALNIGGGPLALGMSTDLHKRPGNDKDWGLWYCILHRIRALYSDICLRYPSLQMAVHCNWYRRVADSIHRLKYTLGLGKDVHTWECRIGEGM